MVDRSGLASYLHKSCEIDGEQTNEFLGLLISFGHMLKQDVAK